jgi:hypothetical protein
LLRMVIPKSRKEMTKVKRLYLWTTLTMLAIVAAVPAMAGVNVSIGISLPPPVVFTASPDVVVMPDTNDAYVVPDVDVDIFFWNGWWWRPWEGRWYRSRSYDRGWVTYSSVPSFYYDVDPHWREHYRAHNWYGHRWNYERIPNRQLQHNWKKWQKDGHWERQRTWGVQAYQPRPHQQRQELRRERQAQYQQRPEVQRHQEHTQQQRQSHVQQPQHQTPVRYSEKSEQPQQHKKSQGKYEGEREARGR